MNTGVITLQVWSLSCISSRVQEGISCSQGNLLLNLFQSTWSVSSYVLIVCRVKLLV